MELKGLKNIIFKPSDMPFEEHRQLARGLGADSMVLLKNNGILPINRGKVALFGAGAVDTIFCGNFSNHVFSTGNVDVKTGLENAGFTLTTTTWLQKMTREVRRANKEDRTLTRELKNEGGKSIHPEELPISVADMAEAVLGTDICIYVIRRETKELQLDDGSKGDYCLTEEENNNLKLISASFKNIILVLNSGLMEIAGVARMKAVKAIVYMGIPGMEAGNALADILTGATNPSGRLADSWAKKFKDYPSCYSKRPESASDDFEIDYKEGIYVGYRYFDSFDVTPLYPFGYGLSYTTFDISCTYFEASWISVIMKVKVTNTGKEAGRQVVQLYVSQPRGKIDKAYQILVGFGKTGKLKPGESQEIKIKVPIQNLWSFDQETNSFVLEAGEYIFRLGDSSRNTSIVAKIELDKDTCILQGPDVLNCPNKMEFLAPTMPLTEDSSMAILEKLNSEDYNSINNKKELCLVTKTYVPEGSPYQSYTNDNEYSLPYRTREEIIYVKPSASFTFFDVKKDKISLEEFVSSLSDEVLARIVCGDLNESVHKVDNRFKDAVKQYIPATKMAAKTSGQYSASLGIPSVSFADGPSGLHIVGRATTCFPAPMNMAQTWDADEMERMGRAYGREMEYFEVDYCLAPSLNIHRVPMWGRAYEFYSEDPILAGLMGVHFVNGVKRYQGRNVVIKHLACYNQEQKLLVLNINVSKQALAELYFKSFYTCIILGQPGGIMNSVNKINGLYASSQRGLNMDLVRNMWSFKGFIMSEWGTKTEKSMDIHAGCDLIMPGFEPEKILEATESVEPDFDVDGYVKRVEDTFVYGHAMIRYEKWGSFILDREGKDYVSTTVAPNVKMSDRIPKLQEMGLCQVTEENGEKTITYRGINRHAYLSRGDLQQAAMHILGEIKNSASMEKLINSVTN
ncbi:MAG: glycoside hydrolase family 3 C-terminal domain-containing protein [Pseudobutyrivibrio sp.]|nr:glycoside hydrolase family 3 C-terminal domain-containing protein [Pseudobutyrivibrio sp.]